MTPKASPRLQLVVEEAILSEDEEVVLLVALAVLALHVPVVLTSHLVLILLWLNQKYQVSVTQDTDQIFSKKQL